MTPTIVYTDRSRVETFETCPRKRLLGYEWRGGLEPSKLSVALETGTALHRVRELVLGSLRVEFEAALATALGEYREKVAANGIVAEENADLERVMGEQYDIVEALSRAWFAVSYPKIVADYEVVAAEREFVRDFTVGDATVRLMVRPDLVLRRRVDGALFIHSLKSTSTADEKWREQWRYDMQTLTEVLGVEGEMGETCGGVIVEGLVKGKKMPWTDETTGVVTYQHANPLVWCWYKSDGMNEEWHARYEWTCTAPHAAYRGTCPGGAKHRLGKGYSKQRVSQCYPGGIKEWVAHQLAGDPAVVEGLVVETPPILRSEYEIERWKRCTLPREIEIARNAADVTLNNGELLEDLADERFPLSTAHGNCTNQYWQKCAFFECCHGTAMADPLAAGFRVRTPNHAAEKEKEKS